jgi:iron complex outermembrane receptor protein
MSFSILGTWIHDLSFTPTSASVTVNQVGTVYNIPDLRATGSVSWASGGTSVGVTLNYVNGFENTLLSPTGRISSWLTTDFRLSHDFSRLGGLARGLRFGLNVANLFDTDPPRVNGGGRAFIDLGYDSVNANPRGRFFSATIAKKF